MVRQVTDVRLADDGRHVVLAVAFEADVVHDDHLVVALDLGEGASQDFGRVLRIAGEEFFVGAHDPRGRIDEPLAARFVAGPADKGAYGVFRRLARYATAQVRVTGVVGLPFFHAAFSRLSCGVRGRP